MPKSPCDVLATRFRVVIEERERERGGGGCRYAIPWRPRRHHRPVQNASVVRVNPIGPLRSIVPGCFRCERREASYVVN